MFHDEKEGKEGEERSSCSCTQDPSETFELQINSKYGECAHAALARSFDRVPHVEEFPPGNLLRRAAAAKIPIGQKPKGGGRRRTTTNETTEEQGKGDDVDDGGPG